MSDGLGRLLQMILLALLQVRYPAAVTDTSVTDAVVSESVHGQDPAYAVYERYRYAYDTYGYLFFSEETGGDMEADGLGSGGSGGSGLNPADMTGDSIMTDSVLLSQLQDYDYLMKHFYNVHASTTAERSLMKADMLLGTDLKLEQRPEEPQIQIYHNHSKETYAEYGPDNPDATFVQNGAYLAELLRARGWNVIHDTSAYDIQGGKLDRNKAYNYALEGITKILEEQPTIQVVLDLHRDGVGQNTRLVTEVDGKPTARLMFFQGMSRTPEGQIDYLPNENLEGNLAFGFQLQMAARDYPGFTRKIYLKGLRYNLHLRARSSLVEVGAQTNTSEEALHAMELLAEVLDRVLQGK